MTPEQQALLARWHEAQRALKYWEAVERELRNNVVNAAFGDYGDGKRTLQLDGGWSLSNSNVTKYILTDTPELRTLVNQFCAYEATAKAGSELVRTGKSELSVRAYKALPPWGKQLMVPYVTTIPQAPQLSLTKTDGS